MKKLVVWIKKRKLSDILFFIFILFALVMRGPSLLQQFEQQGTKLSPVVLEGKLFPPPGKKAVLLFWASWCGPCTIEMDRIEEAILKNEISPINIYAVNLGESQEIINKVISERKLKIPVILDPEGALAGVLNVKVTPTIAFIDEKGKIDWLSSGLSPSLIYRIKHFLKD